MENIGESFSFSHSGSSDACRVPAQAEVRPSDNYWVPKQWFVHLGTSSWNNLMEQFHSSCNNVGSMLAVQMLSYTLPYWNSQVFIAAASFALRLRCVFSFSSSTAWGITHRTPSMRHFLCYHFDIKHCTVNVIVQKAAATSRIVFRKWVRRLDFIEASQGLSFWLNLFRLRKKHTYLIYLSHTMKSWNINKESHLWKIQKSDWLCTLDEKHTAAGYSWLTTLRTFWWQHLAVPRTTTAGGLSTYHYISISLAGISAATRASLCTWTFTLNLFLLHFFASTFGPFHPPRPQPWTWIMSGDRRRRCKYSWVFHLSCIFGEPFGTLTLEVKIQIMPIWMLCTLRFPKLCVLAVISCAYCFNQISIALKFWWPLLSPGSCELCFDLAKTLLIQWNPQAPVHQMQQHSQLGNREDVHIKKEFSSTWILSCSSRECREW